MTLSELVVEYRKEHDLSQRQFAIQCGVSNGYIAMLEKNLNPKTGQPLVPTIPYLQKIAFGMGLTLSELFASVEDMPVDIGLDDEKKPASEVDSGLAEITAIFSQLSPDNRAKLLELSRLYLDAQRKTE